jgi:hypothetical protein
MAYDLDFFEDDPVARAQDPSFYGHERLEEEITEGFRRLSLYGIAIPSDLDKA